MTSVMTTKMSSRGQVVLPEAVRGLYGWRAGTAFVVMAYKGAVIMQPLKAPTEAELAAEFDEAFETSRRQAQAAGMTPDDIGSAIAAVRRTRRARHART